ncbi:four helix bundle protein [Flavobacterium sp.]|uniref:four helix bundle protein n=1 Tax=Flavobacterium sp. TaxID=239 RepID=UPI00261BAE32|nr:four helix bundle protein [Flavobacterium sp.]
MNKPYDLEERTYLFAKNCWINVQKLPKTISNLEDGKQLVRSSGSVGVNYIEANEKLSDKDFLFRIKVSRKEAKEWKYWIRLLQELNPDCTENANSLLDEADELRKIFYSIISKSST